MLFPLLLVFLAAEPAPPPAPDRAIARELVAEVNLARTDPRGYARKLRAERALYQGRLIRRPGSPTDILTREGRPAVDEAIAALERQRPMPALTYDPLLSAAARDHVSDQGPRGAVGHTGSDGSDISRRFVRHGASPYGGENIAYGADTAEGQVIQLLIDDGVPDRGHRKNIFHPGFKRIGAACGPHAVWGYMCVTDFGY